MSSDLTITLDKKTERKVVNLTQSGRKVEAIKLVLDKAQCGLARAKAYVDKINPKPGTELSDKQAIALRDALSQVIPEDLYVPELNYPTRRATPKIGRNDPCHCGSGRKYKKCCLDKTS